jgi:hypothetical protein
MRVVSEKNDEKAAHHGEQRGAGRVGDFQLITAGDEFTAVPEAAGRFHGHDINGGGNDPDYSSYKVIDFAETHGRLFCFGHELMPNTAIFRE